MLQFLLYVPSKYGDIPSILLHSVESNVPFYNNIYLYPYGYKSITNLSNFKNDIK